MLITGIKSRPIYDSISPISRAKRHIIAAQGTGGKVMCKLWNEMQSDQRACSEILYSRESFSGKNLEQDVISLGCPDTALFDTNTSLISALEEKLCEAKIGTVLYLAGSETFIGCAMQVASEHDLNSDEVLREHSGTLARRVLCIHCGKPNDDVTRRIFTCKSCGEVLIVRDHYSRKWAAFMGVKADAECPGEVPADEELDT